MFHLDSLWIWQVVVCTGKFMCHQTNMLMYTNEAIAMSFNGKAIDAYLNDFSFPFSSRTGSN